MSVVIETTLGDITVDLFLKQRPRACLNFLKLCKIKYYNYNLFHTINRNFIAQTGDPTGTRTGGESIFGVIDGPLKRYFQAEKQPRIKHTNMGLISFVGNEDGMIGSQFFLTLGTDLTYLDAQHCVFGELVEGLDVLEQLNEAICDTDNRPYKDIRITHTVILDDPLPDPEKLRVPDRSPSPNAERLQGGRIAPDEEIDETAGRSMEEVFELAAEREAKARATILEMVGDIPDADMAPPENVLFVCKLNPVTTDDDLEIIFSRFGKVRSCEVIRDKKSGDSLQYAFVEFEERKSCEDAYFKMDNVLIDDRRIHVDFSQSVAKIKWHGKGRGVTTYDDRGRRTNDASGFADYKNRETNRRKDSGIGRERKRGYSRERSGDRNKERVYERRQSNDAMRHQHREEGKRGMRYSEKRWRDDNGKREKSNERRRHRSPSYDKDVGRGRRRNDKDDRVDEAGGGSNKKKKERRRRSATDSSSSSSSAEERRKSSKKKKKKRSK